jgi:hypothetical protein
MKLKAILFSLGLVGTATFVACKSRQSNVANAQDHGNDLSVRVNGRSYDCFDGDDISVRVNGRTYDCSGNGGGGDGRYALIEYYKLNGGSACAENSLAVKGRYKDEDLEEYCQGLKVRAGEYDHTIGFIKYGGQCHNIESGNLTSVCRKYATTEEGE